MAFYYNRKAEAAGFSCGKRHSLLSRFMEITFQRELHVHFFQHLGRRVGQWLLHFPVLGGNPLLPPPGFVSPCVILRQVNSLNSLQQLNQKQFKSKEKKNGQIRMSSLKLVQRPLTSLKAWTLLRGKTFSFFFSSPPLGSAVLEIEHRQATAGFWPRKHCPEKPRFCIMYWERLIQNQSKFPKVN